MTHGFPARAGTCLPAMIDHLILSMVGCDARSGICVPKDNTNMKLDRSLSH